MEKSGLKTGTERPRVLFVLHLPPPVHGASLMGARIRDSIVLNREIDARYVNLSASAKLTEIGKGSLKKIAFIVRLIAKVRREIRSWKPDLLYLTPTSTLPGIIKDYLVVIAARRAGVRVVSHFHNKGVSKSKDRWLADLFYRRFFRGMEIILLSPRLYADIEKYVPLERVHFCANGISPIETETVPHQGFRFLFLSNLIPEKGVMVLLDACKILKENGERFVCEYVGAPSVKMSETAFRSAIAERELDDTVVYEGPAYGEMKDAALARADAFVFPTYYPYECFPLVLLEALSVGLPVISTDEGAIADIVQDNVNGCICNKRDPESVATAMKRMMDDPARAHEMGAAGKQLFFRQFTAEAFEKNLLSILTGILS